MGEDEELLLANQVGRGQHRLDLFGRKVSPIYDEKERSQK